MVNNGPVQVAAAFIDINGIIWEYIIHVAIDRVIDMSAVIGNTAAGAAAQKFILD